jgi:VIT1/CCC1 family predicted Fe2+/Mn2+ transporter
MTARRPTQARLQAPAAPPAGNLLAQFLDPIDVLAEVIFSVLIILTFTLWFGIIKLGATPDKLITVEYMNEFIVAVFAATLAWGIIDGIMLALLSVFARGERHRFLADLQAAASDEEAIDLIAGEFDFNLEPITGEQQRQALYVDMLEHLRDSKPRPVGFQSEDLLGALTSVVVAVLAIVPSLVPLVLLRDQGILAVRISNGVSFFVLFTAGYLWGRYTGANPWKTGLLLLGAGVIMMAIAIPLGG